MDDMTAEALEPTITILTIYTKDGSSGPIILHDGGQDWEIQIVLDEYSKIFPVIGAWVRTYVPIPF